MTASDWWDVDYYCSASHAYIRRDDGTVTFRPFQTAIDAISQHIPKFSTEAPQNFEVGPEPSYISSYIIKTQHSQVND